LTYFNEKEVKLAVENRKRQQKKHTNYLQIAGLNKLREVTLKRFDETKQYLLEEKSVIKLTGNKDSEQILSILLKAYVLGITEATASLLKSWEQALYH
jgi:hypothetical protein